MTMYKSIVLYTGLGLALALTGCQSSDTIGRPMAVAGETVATVNGVKITDTDLKATAQSREQTGQSMSAQEVLDQAIEVELLRQKAVATGVHNDPQLASQINRQTSIMLISKYFQDALTTPPSDDEIKQAYDKQIAEMPKTEYKVRHILVGSEDEAKGVIASLKKGGDFSKLAKQKSTDSSAQQGGSLDWVSPRNLVTPFADAMQKLQPGKYTEEPVKSQFGWHVIIVDDTRDAKLPSLDMMRAYLTQSVRNNRVQDTIKALRDSAKIEIVKPVPAEGEAAPAAEGAPAAATDGAQPSS
jgi:peptidyl-prolyl cis-trans isomerase C